MIDLFKNTKMFSPKSTMKSSPFFEIIAAETIIRGFYLLPSNPQIVIDGIEHIPSDKTVIFAFHQNQISDFIPFLLGLYRNNKTRYPAFWAPNEFYDNIFSKIALPFSNKIVFQSRAKFISDNFLVTTGRAPSPVEMDTLLGLLDYNGTKKAVGSYNYSPSVLEYLSQYGSDIEGQAKSFCDSFKKSYSPSFTQFINSNIKALNDYNLNVLGFVNPDTKLPGSQIDSVLPYYLGGITKRAVHRVTGRFIKEEGFTKRNTLYFKIEKPVYPNSNAFTRSKALQNGEYFVPTVNSAIGKSLRKYFADSTL